MTESKFQFSNPTLEKISFEVCDGFAPENFEGISIESTTEIKILDEQNAEVSLTVNIGNGEKNQPFNISVKMNADFEWEDSIKGEDAKRMLKVNGSSVLLSYIRPIVSGLTGSSKYTAWHIPFIDFTSKI